MSCIQLHYPYLHLQSQHQHKQRLKNDNLIWQEPHRLVTSRRKMSVKTMALANPLILEVASPVHKGGDISVLIPTGSLLLLLYFITNFIVPDFIMQYRESDEESENTIPKNDSSLTLKYRESEEDSENTIPRDESSLTVKYRESEEESENIIPSENTTPKDDSSLTVHHIKVTDSNE